MSLINRAAYAALVDEPLGGTGSTGTRWDKSHIASVLLDPIDAAQFWTSIAPTTTGTQNNWAPGLSGHTVIYANNASLLTITGFAGGVVGQRVVVVAVGAGQVDFTYNAAASAAGNKLITFVTVGRTSLAGSGLGVAEFVYDPFGRWQMVNHNQGAWITAPYSAGDYTATTGTWTVSSPIVRYRLHDRTLDVKYAVLLSSVSAATANLFIKAPGGLGLFAMPGYEFNRAVDNGAAASVGMVKAEPFGGALQLWSTIGGGGWAISASQTSVEGRCTLEVL